MGIFYEIQHLTNFCGNPRIKFSDPHPFSRFQSRLYHLAYTYFAHIAASGTVTENVTNQAMHIIFNTNYKYSRASSTLKFNATIQLH